MIDGLVYDKTYDAYYDPVTLEWAEATCSDPECEFCKDRPEKAEEERR